MMESCNTFKPSLQSWLSAFIQRSPSTFVDNVDTQFFTLPCGVHSLPVTLNHTEYTNSYVVSPYTAFILYSKEEIYKIKNPVVRVLLRGLINICDGVFKRGKANQVIMVNNWLLSTNLYPNIEKHDLVKLTQHLKLKYPNHAIIFRSLNWKSNKDTLSTFQSLDYQLAASRQVYLFKPEQDYLKRNNCKNDIRLQKKSSYKIVSHSEITESDYPRIVELYNKLYLQKYSYYNPQFNIEFIKMTHKNRSLEMMGLRNPEGKLDAIMGCFQVDNIITAPLVGYDIHKSQSLGLYRLLMIWLLQKSQSEGLVLNLSSGASHFKRLRGGEAVMEYSAMYTKHLSWARRLFFTTLQILANRIAKPLLERYEL